MDTVVYTLVPPQGKASVALFIPVVLVVLVSLVGSFVVVRSVTGAKGSTFTLSPAGLAIRGDLYGRTIPADRLRGAAARVIDLRAEPGLVPARRTMGSPARTQPRARRSFSTARFQSASLPEVGTGMRRAVTPRRRDMRRSWRRSLE